MGAAEADANAQNEQTQVEGSGSSSAGACGSVCRCVLRLLLLLADLILRLLRLLAQIRSAGHMKEQHVERRGHLRQVSTVCMPLTWPLVPLLLTARTLRHTQNRLDRPGDPAEGSSPQ